MLPSILLTIISYCVVFLLILTYPLYLFSGSLPTYHLAHLLSPSHRLSPSCSFTCGVTKVLFSALFCSIYTQPHLVLSSVLPPSLSYYTRTIHSFLSHLLPTTFLLSSQIYSQPFHFISSSMSWNCLTLNPSKTEFLFIALSQQTKNYQPFAPSTKCATYLTHSPC